MFIKEKIQNMVRIPNSEEKNFKKYGKGFLKLY